MNANLIHENRDNKWGQWAANQVEAERRLNELIRQHLARQAMIRRRAKLMGCWLVAATLVAIALPEIVVIARNALLWWGK